MNLRFNEHPCFVKPDDQSRLWRYMSFSKFARMVTDQSIWFPSLADLARTDPFEGALPNQHFRHRAWQTITDLRADDRVKIEQTGYARNNTLKEKMECEAMLREHRILQTYAARHEMFVSCWFESPHESAGMWSIYSASGEGIAIVSSPPRLRLVPGITVG